MLTRRGWVLVGGVVAVVVAGALFGIEELYGLAVAAVTLLGVSAAWVHGRTWRLHTARSVSPGRVAAGDEARVDLAVHNLSSRRSPVVTIRDPFAGGERSTTLLVAPLQPGQADRASYRLPATKRGVFAVGPLEMTLVDPFGLVALTRPGAAASTLVVHPRVERLRPPVATGADRRRESGAPVVGVRGEEFFALRSYRSGDDLRRVHWAATARAGELMIRQEEAQHRGRVIIGLDLRAGVWRPAALEVALSGAAGIATAAGGAGLDVRLVHTGGVDTGYRSPGRRGALLDELAVAAVHGGRDRALPSLLRSAGLAGSDAGATIVITSDAATDADLAGLGRLAGHGRRLTTVLVWRDHDGRIDGATSNAHRDGDRVRVGAGSAGLGGATVVRVRAGVGFAAGWDRAGGSRSGAWSDA